jgi:hypothetical protein
MRSTLSLSALEGEGGGEERETEWRELIRNHEHHTHVRDIRRLVLEGIFVASNSKRVRISVVQGRRRGRGEVTVKGE